MDVSESGKRFPSESYRILPENSRGRHRSPMMIDFFQIASSSSSSSSSCTFLNEIIFNIDWALLLILLFIFERSFLSLDSVSSSFSLLDDFFLWWEAQRNVTSENTENTLIRTKKRVKGVDWNWRFCVERFRKGLAMGIIVKEPSYQKYEQSFRQDADEKKRKIMKYERRRF